MNRYPDELAHFAKDGASWWDENGPFKPLHQINPIRLSYIQSQLNLQQASVVDIGCGGGILAESLAKAGAKVTGIDLVESSLATAKAHAEQSQLTIDYRLVSAEDYSERYPGQADLVTCLELLEHVPYPESIIQAARTILKPHGLLICSTLNRHPKAFLFGIVAAEYILGLVPKGTHHYSQFIKPSELNTMAVTEGFDLIDTKGLQFDPWRGLAKLSNDVSINYLMTFKRV